MNPPDLQVLSFAQLEQADVPVLTAICDAMPEPITLQELFQQLADGACMAWRVEDALIITKTMSDQAKPELFVLGMAGRGIVARLDQVASDLREVARTLGCCIIGGNVSSPGLKRLYDRLGAAPIYTYYVMEV